MTPQIDISKLPPPVFAASPGFAAIVAATLARVRQLMGENAPELDLDSDPAAMVVQGNAWRETLAYAAVNDAAKATLLPWAKGPNLDWIAANLGARARHPGESDDDFRLRVQSANRGVSTAGPRSAWEALSLAASSLVADAAAISAAAGSVTVDILVAGGSETLALDALPGATGELARALLETGAAPDLYKFEASGELLAGSLALASGLTASRLFYDAANSTLKLYSAEAGLANWATAGGAGNAKYVFLHDGASGLALQVSAAARLSQSLSWTALGVSAKAWLSALPAGGRLLLIVADANPAGAAPPNVDIAHTARAARALHAVRAALNDEDARPMGDIVTVREAASAAYSVTASIETAPGPDPSAVLASVRTAVQSYADGQRRIGAAVKLGAIYAALYGPGVTSASISSPGADIAAVAGTAPECSQVTVTLQ